MQIGILNGGWRNEAAKDVLKHFGTALIPIWNDSVPLYEFHRLVTQSTLEQLAETLIVTALAITARRTELGIILWLKLCDKHVICHMADIRVWLGSNILRSFSLYRSLLWLCAHIHACMLASHLHQWSHFIPAKLTTGSMQE